ncbi:Site-specific recombinase, phage integrase family [uncultured Candidatus Thioglobus sp.]|nr:Site-specific recombinase, phage integrase family [uncultured Candidatus Thioglobus sp.]
MHINSETESEWNRLREYAQRGFSSKATLSDSTALLNDFGLDSEYSHKKTLSSQDELNANAFIDHIQNKLPDKAQNQIFENNGNDRDLFSKIIRDFLNPHEARAMDIFKNGITLTLSEYPKLYAELSGRDINSKAIKDVITNINLIIDLLGDRAVNEYSRIDANSLIKARLKSGVKTTTISKNFTLINAAIEKVNREYEIESKNPFTQPNIPKLGNDTIKRKIFSNNQMNTLRDWTLENDTTVSKIIQVAMDTGMRLAEVVGLMSSDVQTKDGIKYIALKENKYIGLKNSNSERDMPLVGVALLAIESLDLTQKLLFPNYFDSSKGSFKTTSASNAISKRIRAILNDKKSPTAHSFRHTMASRLRNVEASADALREIGGWKKDMADKYGDPVSLEIRRGYMLKTLNI